MIGRRAQRDVLESRLALALDGRGQLVVIEAEAGMGKTTLVRAFAADAPCRVVTVSGDEIEADLPGGVAEQLLAHLDASAERHPMATTTGQVPDAVAVGGALVDAISHATAVSPLALVVDDAHWSDVVSLQALTFALRRLDRDPVLTILTTRPEGATRLPDGLRRLLEADDAEQIELAGLTPAEVQELVRRLVDVDLSDQAAARIALHTGGNPLHVTALAREVDATELGVDSLELLPAPRAFGLRIANRLAACSEPARRLIEAVAVLGGPTPLSHAIDVAFLPEGLALKAAGEAVRHDLLETVDGPRGRVVRFAHPLIRAAVYQALAAPLLSTLHDTAAALAVDERERLRHRVGAVALSDAELAHDLEAFAAAEAERGSFASAATACLAAARVAVSREDRERLVLHAAGVLIRSNDPRSAAALSDEIVGFATTPVQSYILGILAGSEGQLDEAKTRFETGWKLADPAAPGLQMALASRLAATCLVVGANSEAVGWIREIAQLEPSDDIDDDGYELMMVALIAGGMDVAVEFLAARPDLYRPNARGWPRGLPGLLVLQSAGPDADPQGALAAGRDALEHYRLHGPPADWIGCLEKVAHEELHLGMWDEAIATCETMRAGASALGLFLVGDVAAIHAATIQCRRGDATGARETLATIDPGSMLLIPVVAVVNAELLRNEGDHSGAADVLAPLAALAPFVPVLCEPSYLPWRQLYAVALIAAGRSDEARVEIDWLRARIADRPYPSVVAAASRCEALLAASDDDTTNAGEHFRAAIAAARDSENVYELATIEFEYGSFLRRGGKRTDAAEVLEAARELFMSLRAGPAIDRCDHELGLLGRKRQSRGAATPPTLTAAEHAVARLVAEGATNRAVAAQLVVSVRTVEYHLSNIYSKLGISSRSQLIHAISL